MGHRRRNFVCAGLLASLWVSAAWGREWHARNGSSSVEAELLDFRDGLVVLKRKDGKVVSVPLDKLSLADVKYVQEALGAAGGLPASAPPNGLAPAPGSVPSKPPAPPAASPASTRRPGPPPAKPNSTRWQVAPDPAPPESKFEVADDLAIRPVNRSSRDSIFPVLPGPGFLQLNDSSREPSTVFNLGTGGKQGGVTFADVGVRGKAVSPQGLWTASALSGKSQIVIHNVVTGQIAHSLTLSKSSFSLAVLAFLDEERLLAVLESSGPATVWDVRSGERIVEFPISDVRDHKLAVSAGGAYLAHVETSAKRLTIYDLRNGAVAGTIDLASLEGYLDVKGLSFSDDGQELSLLCELSAKGHLYCWDLSAGNLAVEHSLGRSMRKMLAASISYEGAAIESLPEKKGWLLYGRAVVDRNQGGPIWIDADGEDVHSDDRQPRRLLSDARQLVFTGKSQSRTLVVRKLPWDVIEQGAKIVAAGGAAQDIGLPPLTRVRLADAQPRTLAARLDGWPLPSAGGEAAGGEAAGGGASAAAAMTDQPISLGEVKAAGTRVRFGSPETGVAGVASYAHASDTLLKKLQQITRYDLRTGKETGKVAPKFPSQGHDISPSGKLALFFSGDDKERLDVWAFDGERHVAGFRPFQDGEFEGLNGAQDAAFVDDEHLLTLATNGRLVLWKLPSCEPVYSLPRIGSIRIPLDARRRRMLVIDLGQSHLVDPRTGECLATLESPSQFRLLTAAAASFQAEGQRLAVLNSGDVDRGIAVWDLKTGKLECDTTTPAGGFFLAWTSPRHLLFEAPPVGPVDRDRPQFQWKPPLRLFDVERQHVVWQYKTGLLDIHGGGPDDRLWATHASIPRTAGWLLSRRLPSGESAAAIARMPILPPLVARGTPVALTIKSTIPNVPDEQNRKLESELRKRLDQQLETHGFPLRDDAPVTLDVLIEEKPTGQTKSFRMFGAFLPANVTVPITRVHCDLVFRLTDGDPFWLRRTFFDLGDNVGHDRIPPNVTLEEFLRSKRSDQVMKWTREATVPGRILDPRLGKGAGGSTLALEGEKEIETAPPIKTRPAAGPGVAPLST